MSIQNDSPILHFGNRVLSHIPCPQGGLGAQSWRALASLWHSCGIVVAWSWLSRGISMRVAAFWSHPEPSWKQLGPSRRPKMPPSWLQEASRWLYVGSSWPQDDQNGLPRPPRCLKNASGRPQDELKIENFEVFVRKT